MRRGRAAAPILLLPLLACVAQLGPEPAVRILSRERAVALRLTSRTPLQVFADGPGGAPGELLGETPVVVHEITIAKEIWKEGPGEPAPPPPAPAQQRSDGGDLEPAAEPQPGPAPALRAHVWVAAPGEEPRRLRLDVPVQVLQESYRRGRLEVDVADLEPAPPGGPG